MYPRIAAMDAMDRVIASMSPDDTAVALRLLKALRQCRQISPTEADEWRRRITGWAGFNGVDRESEPSA
jgi:hypothetical protein